MAKYVSRWAEANQNQRLLKSKLEKLGVDSIQVVLEDIEGSPYFSLEYGNLMTVQLDVSKTLSAWDTLPAGCTVNNVWDVVVCLDVMGTISPADMAKRMFNQNTIY